MRRKMADFIGGSYVKHSHLKDHWEIKDLVSETRRNRSATFHSRLEGCDDWCRRADVDSCRLANQIMVKVTWRDRGVELARLVEIAHKEYPRARDSTDECEKHDGYNQIHSVAVSRCQKHARSSNQQCSDHVGTEGTDQSGLSRPKGSLVPSPPPPGNDVSDTFNQPQCNELTSENRWTLPWRRKEDRDKQRKHEHLQGLQRARTKHPVFHNPCAIQRHGDKKKTDQCTACAANKLPEGIPALVKVGQHQSTRSVMSPILAPLSECRPREPSFGIHTRLSHARPRVANAAICSDDASYEKWAPSMTAPVKSKRD